MRSDWAAVSPRLRRVESPASGERRTTVAGLSPLWLGRLGLSCALRRRLRLRHRHERVDARDGVLELAQSLAERPAHLREALRAKDEEHRDENDEHLRQRDVEWHAATLRLSGHLA